MSEPAESPDLADTTDTRLLGGKLTLRQPRHGHRVGTDAVLLAAAAAPAAGDYVIDVGSGVGSVGLAIAMRDPGVRVDLVEVLTPLAELACGNAQRAGLQHRTCVYNIDLFDPGKPALGGADWVLSNPPFQLAGEARPSPDGWRARAHRLEPGVGHGDWLRAMIRLAAPGGSVVLIHRPEALPDLLQAAEGRLGNVRILPVHPRDDRDAIRILFAATLGTRAPLSVLPPLVLHRADGTLLPHAKAVNDGEALIDLRHQRKSRPRRPALAP